MNKLILPFGEWLPDQPTTNNPGAAYLLNAIPLTAQSWGPVSDLAAYSPNALSLRCQGAFPALDSTATVSLFAADQKDLYRYQGGATGFVKVSKATSPYNCPASDMWTFAQFGSNIYAANVNDPLQSMALSGTAFADVGGGAPKAKYLAVVRDFLVAGWTNDGTAEPQRVWWSAINNPVSWPTPGTGAALQVQSDYQDIAGNRGWLQGIVANLGYTDAAVFFERGVWRMQYAGAPAIFDFQPAEGVRGTPAPQSLVQLGSTVFYLGEDGFYGFDGAQSIPIGAGKVDKWFWSQVDQGALGRVQGAVDPLNKVVCWAIPTAGSNGSLTQVIGYRVDLQRWFRFVPQPFEFMQRMLSIGYTLEGLSAVYPVLENVPAPLDSRIWTGGKVVLGAFDATHKLSYFTGNALAATLETSERELASGRTVLVNTLRPIVDGSPSGLNAATLQVLTRYNSADAATVTGAVPNSYGLAPVRADGRFARARIQLPTGGWTHAQGVEVEFRAQGAR